MKHLTDEQTDHLVDALDAISTALLEYCESFFFFGLLWFVAVVAVLAMREAVQ